MATRLDQPKMGKRRGAEHTLLACWLAIIAVSFGAVFVSADDAGRGGDVEFIVRGPDSRALAGARVTILPAARASEGGQTHEITAQADAEGRVRFRWTLGVIRQMAVRVDNVGYGFTGAVEVVNDRAARISLAPLVPFASVSGSIPFGLSTPRSVVKFKSVSHPFDEDTVVSFVADGRFTANVRAGRWHIVAIDGNKRLGESDASITLIPGQVVKGLALHPPGAEAEKRGEEEVAPADQGPWAKGVIRDEAGRAIPNAAVYGVAVYSANSRMYEAVAKVMTDAAGHYELKGDAGINVLSASVIAALPNRPPAWAWSQPSRPGALLKAPAVKPDVDVVIPAKGGSLEVSVRHDNQPITGASVMAWLEGYDLRDIWAAGATALERREVEAIVHPIKAVDRSGVARFDNLLPGSYRIVAAMGDVDHVRDIQDSSLWETPDAYAIAEGVAVRLGQSTSYRMNIFPQGVRVPVSVSKADGKPLTTGTPFDYTSPAVGEWGRAVEAKAGNILEGMFESPGLRRVSFKYRDSGIGTMHAGEEPFYEAAGMIGASHLLEIKARVPAKFRAMRYDPGAVNVELRSATNQRMKAVIELDDEQGRRAFAGSTDASGTVRFEGAPTGKYIVRTYLPGEMPLDIGTGETPLPTPDQTINHTAALTQLIDVTPNNETQVSLKADAVGYLSGSVKPAANHKTDEYSVTAVADGREAPVHYRPTTGEFIAGPFDAGRIKVTVWPGEHRSDDQHSCASQEVTLDPAKPAHIGLIAGEPNAADAKPGARLPTRGPDLQITGRVLQHDGKTPAVGARIVLLSPPDAETVLSGLTDGLGNIHAHRLPRYPRDTTGDLTQPTIVAWLPGYAGAVTKVAPNGQADKLELILPAPISVKGKVNIAGLAPPGRNEKIRVMAGYVGKGSLTEYLSVQTIAQSDGTFELAGLTPGKYEIQAALDDLWLSESVTITAAEGPIQPMTLNVGAPGGPLTVRIVGSGGKPIKARPVMIDRPKGPLNTLLWPSQWVTDGAGEVWIPALEAGEHNVKVSRTNRTGQATVPGLPADRAVALQIQIDERAGP